MLSDIPPTSPQAAHFYLGSSSGDATSENIAAEADLNFQPNGSFKSRSYVEDEVVGEVNCDVNLTDEQVLHILSVLESGSLDEIACTVAYLCHATYGNMYLKGKLACCGVVDIISKLLQCSSLTTRKYCVGILRNISRNPTQEILKLIDVSSVVSNLIIVLNEMLEESTKSTPESGVICESIAATLCNLALYSEFKDTISRSAVPCLNKLIITPYTEFDQNAIRSVPPNYDLENPAFIYATGTVRNLLDEDAERRHQIRELPGLLTALSRVCTLCVEDCNFDGKALENCMCILRNLSFALQEVRDPAYLVRREVNYASAATTPVLESSLNLKPLRCDTVSRVRDVILKKMNRRVSSNVWMEGRPDYLDRPPSNLEGIQGSRQLWSNELVENYIAILRYSTNTVTIEAASGAIQNLTACDWEPSAAVRSLFHSRDNVLVLAAPLISEDDGVVLTTATALRNVAEQEDLRSHVAFYAMPLLISRLPVLQAESTEDGEIVVPTHNLVSLTTTCAILAALYVLVDGNIERAKTFLNCGGVPPCMAIAHTGIYVDHKDPVPSSRDKAVRFARSLLRSLWQHRDLRHRFQKSGWGAAHFCAGQPLVRPLLNKSFLGSLKNPALPGEDEAPPNESGGQPGDPPPNIPELVVVNEDKDLSDSLRSTQLPELPSPARGDSSSLVPQQSQPLLTVASAMDIPRLMTQNSKRGRLPNPKSFPSFTRPETPPRSECGRISRQPSSATFKMSPEDRGLSPRSQDGTSNPSKRGYFDRLNVPEIIACHPTPKREVPIERAASPFMRLSASTADLASLVESEVTKDPNNLTVPSGLRIPQSPGTSLRYNYSSASMLNRNFEKPVTPRHVAALSTSPTSRVIPPSPTIKPPAPPSQSRLASSTRTRAKDETRRENLSRLSISSQSSASDKYRLTTPPAMK